MQKDINGNLVTDGNAKLMVAGMIFYERELEGFEYKENKICVFLVDKSEYKIACPEGTTKDNWLEQIKVVEFQQNIERLDSNQIAALYWTKVSQEKNQKEHEELKTKAGKKPKVKMSKKQSLSA